jgi:SOS response regulatory protein OraA/RecX
MSRVTALRETRRGVAVEIDGAAWRTLPVDVVVRAELLVGSDLDRPRARAVRRELRRHEALARAGRALRARDLTAFELDTRLEQAGYAGVERGAAIGTLKRAGLVDDERFADGRAASLAARGWGDEAISWRLKQAGVAAETASAAVSRLEPEAQRARRIAVRRGGGPAVAAFLGRRGFSEESVEAAGGAEGRGAIDS